MSKIAFIGLDEMGLAMARNLINAGHAVKGYDASKKARDEAEKSGLIVVPSIAEAVTSVEAVITLIPDKDKARETYLGEGGILKSADPATLLIDCSNRYVAVSNEIQRAAEGIGFQIIDAPAAGDLDDTKAGNLTFLVRGEDKAFLEGETYLQAMAAKVFHFGSTRKQSKKKEEENPTRVVYKKNPRWKRATVILILLFLGGNAVFYALIEENIKIVNGKLTLTYEMESYEYKIFCRGSRLIGLDIEGC